MLVCISCLKVIQLVPRYGVGCNLDPLGSERVEVIVYVGQILIVKAEMLVCGKCLKVVQLVPR